MNESVLDALGYSPQGLIINLHDHIVKAPMLPMKAV